MNLTQKWIAAACLAGTGVVYGGGALGIALHAPTACAAKKEAGICLGNRYAASLSLAFAGLGFMCGAGVFARRRQGLPETSRSFDQPAPGQEAA
jgi:hypothetical protein